LDPEPILHEMRLFKSPDEVATMRRAASITRDAHIAAMQQAAPGRYEYEIDAALTQVFRRQGSQRAAYGSIVGSGPNATVLHYRDNNRLMREGELLLVDAGCELDYYASDVTRTYPVSGRFSAPQRAIYQIVLDAQVAAIEATRPGATLDEIHMRAVHVIVDGLLRLGLLQGEHDTIVAEGLYRPFYMHRTSHWLGMDVHDVGAYYREKSPRQLQPGMVITVEPGIYIAENQASVPAEYRNIGVRIEDDVLVTADGCLNLTADIPKTVGELESVCSS
jgi:Xaa-Pro aminopeptidase